MIDASYQNEQGIKCVTQYYFIDVKVFDKPRTLVRGTL